MIGGRDLGSKAKCRRTGDWRSGPKLKRKLARVNVTHQQVADAYGCRRPFVTSVLSGTEPCPQALLTVIADLIADAERGRG